MREAATRLPTGSWITRGDWGAYEQWNAGSAGAVRGRAGADGAGPFTPVPRSHRCSHARIIPSSCNRFDRSMFLANSRALELGEDHGEHAESAERRDRQGRRRPSYRDSQGHRRRHRPPRHSARAFRAAARAGARGPERSTRGRRDDDAGPDVRGAVAGVSGTAAARRADVADHAATDARQRHAHAARSGISTGFGDEWLRFIGYKAWVDGIMGSSGAMFFEPYTHDPKNKGLLRDIMRPEGQEGAAMGMTADAALHRLPAGQPREADRGDNRNRSAAARPRDRRQGQPDHPRRLREAADETQTHRARSSVAGHPRAGRARGRLRALRQAEAGRRDQSVPRLRRHAVDGRAHRSRALARGVRVPQAEGRGRRVDLRQRQPGHQRGALLPQSRLRPLRCRFTPDTRRESRRPAGSRING